MKYFRLVMLAALVLVFSGAAFADDIHVIFDPQPATLGTLNLIQSTGVDYTVDWANCGDAVFANTGFSGDAACLAFLNQTGAAINELNFGFTVNAALVGQTIACDNAPGDTHLDGNDCAATPGPFVLGQVVNVSFFGGDPIPSGFAFYIAENGVALADAPPVGVEVPEPASLTLLASGMGLLGLCLVLAKR
ncbi:MAG: PEP-CTERM sorting domain-containing protein [Candidatus Acidiferrum sp.]